MKRIKAGLMPSLRKVMELIEKRSLVGLAHKEKIRLLLHTSRSDCCTTY